MYRVLPYFPSLLFDDLVPLWRVACLGIVPFSPTLGTTECLPGFGADAEQTGKFCIDLFAFLYEIFYSCDSVVDMHLQLPR